MVVTPSIPLAGAGTVYQTSACVTPDQFVVNGAGHASMGRNGAAFRPATVVAVAPVVVPLNEAPQAGVMGGKLVAPQGLSFAGAGAGPRFVILMFVRCW